MSIAVTAVPSEASVEAAGGVETVSSAAPTGGATAPIEQSETIEQVE